MPSWTIGATEIDHSLQGNTLTNAATGEDISLAMQRLHLSGRVSAAGAFLRIIHVFKCEGESPLEALYTFMLPRTGTLRRFIVKGEDFEVESQLNEREEAKEIYEEGVQEGHLSVLAETYNDGMVTLSVGQVSPDEIVTVMLDIVCGVDVEDSKFRFRFPFTLAPSYHSKGNATATNDGIKIDLPSDVFGDLILPEWKNIPDGLHQVSFKLHVESAGDLDSVASPSHRVLVRPLGDGSAEIELAGSADVPNRDLVVDVKTKNAVPTLFADKYLISKKTEKDDPVIPDNAPRWSFAIPSKEITPAAEEPRRICFVVDRSGSMKGATMDRAKLACRACLSAIQPKDSFGLVVFDDHIDKFDENMGRATDVNRKRADKWISRIGARGMTELSAALGAAIDVLGGPGGDIFLITDGQVFNTGPIIEQVGAAGTRIHILGIGEASQDRFLEALSRRSGGVSKMIGTREDVAAAALKLFNTACHPVQSDIKAIVNFKDGKNTLKQQHQIDTVWDGHTIILTDDRSSFDAIPESVLLKWDGGEVELKPEMVHETPNGLVALLWAGRKIEDLECALDMCREGPAKSATERDLKKISGAYSLASRAMSLCAVVNRIGDQPGEQPQQKVVPVGLPENMDSLVSGLPSILRSTGFRSVPSASPIGVYAASAGSSGWHGFTSSGRRSESVKCSLAVSSSRTSKYDRSNTSMGFDPPQQSCFFVGDDEFTSNAITTMPEDLINVLTGLRDDGGMDGDDIQERIVLTALIALEVLKAALDEDTSIYDMHLNRMVDFLEDHQSEDEEIREGLDKVLELIRNRQIKPYMMTEDYLAKAVSISVQKDNVESGLQMVCNVGTSR